MLEILPPVLTSAHALMVSLVFSLLHNKFHFFGFDMQLKYCSSFRPSFNCNIVLQELFALEVMVLLMR